MSSPESFEEAIEASHKALDEIARGNLDAFMHLYSERDDPTVGNPYGPPARGRDEIEQAGRRAAANYRDGRAIEFENFATYVSGDLGYTFEIERFETKVAGSDELTPVSLRVTSIFASKTAPGSFFTGMPTRSRLCSRESRSFQARHRLARGREPAPLA